MIVVHGWWSLPASPVDGGALVLWAEDGLAPAEGSRRPGRRPKVRDHPFAVDADLLVQALGLPDGQAVTATADLTLPAFSNAPSASPELLDLRSMTQAGVGEGETLRLRPDVRWRVPTVTLESDPALALLTGFSADRFTIAAAPDERDPDSIGVRIGSDLRQIVQLATFAADLAGRGRVLPVVLFEPGERTGTGLGTARWRPVITGSDADWFRAAVAALPSSYRAGAAATSGTGGPQPGDQLEPAPVEESAAAALDALVDAVVRERIGVPATPAQAKARGASDGAALRSGPAGWRQALRGPDATFEATGRQLAQIGEALADWHAEAAGGGTVRACFRLVEPRDDDETGTLYRPSEPARSGEENANWRIEFGLQAADEPSLIVPAEQIWAPGAAQGGTLQTVAGSIAQLGPARNAKKQPAAAKRAAPKQPAGQVAPAGVIGQIPRPQETLLAELGRALRLYPSLSIALSGPRPAELELDTAAAHSFLAEIAPLLIGAGFGVLLPGWWSNPKSRLGARLRAGTPGQPGRVDGAPALGQQGLVSFDWRLSVGDELLTDPEVQGLIESQQPLVRLRGEWMQVDPERLRKARDFLRRKNSGAGMTVGEVLRVLGSMDEGPGGLPVTGVEAEGWLGDLLAPSADRQIQPVPVSRDFTGTLRPYQERGLAWLSFLEEAGLGALLADDMGLGKTVQLLALIARDLETAADNGRAAGPTLLVCPMSLVGNWQREAAKFTPQLRVHVQHGKERPQGKDFRAAVEASDLVVTTYSLLARDAVALRKLPWRRVVLDEAQAVKNAATQAAIAARSLKAPRRIAVTGTPVENRLADLWSLMEFANPKLLGDAADFKRRFALPIERLGNQEASARLRDLTRPFVLRRLKTDSSIISDLPAKLEMEVVCTLTGEQAGLYQSVVADMLERINGSSGIERRGLVLATMTKLKQVCNHPAQFMRDGSRVGGGRSGKLARLEETLEEVLAAGEKALLFTQYAEFGEMLRTHLTARFGREVIFLHGGVGKAQRDAMVARFQSDNRQGPPLFVLSLKAGGTGLTLTAANHVIHVDRWWNPAVEDQATDRAFRIGQTRAVQVRKFVCAGTLEEKISAMIQDKRGLAGSVVGTGEGWLTELSTAQLRDLITLDAGSVVEQ